MADYYRYDGPPLIPKGEDAMTICDAILTKQPIEHAYTSKTLHVQTCDGQIGTVEKIEYNYRRGGHDVTLRHSNGEAFPHVYASSACTIIERN